MLKKRWADSPSSDPKLLSLEKYVCIYKKK